MGLFDIALYSLLHLRNASCDYYYHTFDIQQKEHQLKDPQLASLARMRKILHRFAFAFRCLLSIMDQIKKRFSILRMSLHNPSILTFTGSLALGGNVRVDTEIMS